MTDQESSSVRVKSRRAVTEGFVIVVSILLAFAIDAWWDSAKAHQDEQAVLEAIGQNLEETAIEVERALRINERLLTGARRFFESSPSDLAALTADSARLILDGLASVVTLQPVDAAIRREDLAHLSDPEIRFAVSAWLGRVDDLLEDQPLIHDALKDVEEVITVEALATGLEVPSLVHTPENEQLAGLRRDERVLRAVLRKHQVERIDSRKLGELRDATQDLRQALQR